MCTQFHVGGSWDVISLGLWNILSVQVELLTILPNIKKIRGYRIACVHWNPYFIISCNYNIFQVHNLYLISKGWTHIPGYSHVSSPDLPIPSYIHVVKIRLCWIEWSSWSLGPVLPSIFNTCFQLCQVLFPVHSLNIPPKVVVLVDKTLIR